MTADEWKIQIERLQGRMNVQENELSNMKASIDARFVSFEKSIEDKLMRADRRLVNIESDTRWLVRWFIAGVLSTAFAVLVALVIFAASVGFDPIGVTGALETINAALQL